MLLCLRIFFLLSAITVFLTTSGQQKSTVTINEMITYQTIQNFGASDAWSCQFVGNWPAKKRNTIADWLFSMDTLVNGNPVGIGLSLWRYNLGAGSAEQKDESKIKDEWRRASLTTGKSANSNKRVQAQNWFLLAAKKRGVLQYVGFFNSPPVHLTKNGKAFADKGEVNLALHNYQSFADYAIKAISHIKKATGVSFTYLSPVNEPQWDWSDGGQEGCPYTNEEISLLVKMFSKRFLEKNVNIKLLVPESGDLSYLLSLSDKKSKDEQIKRLFSSSSPYFIGNLPNVSPVIAAHSYFTTSPFEKGMAIRKKVKDSINQIKGLSYWQTEYCILGDNNGEIDGSKRDTGMNAGLYLAKVIYQDIVGGNAEAWQWWTSISPYDYKDGLIYIDKNKTDGNFLASKMLWVMGNYSRFVRPGMKRIEVTTASKDLHISGYKDFANSKIVLVIVNDTKEQQLLTPSTESVFFNQTVFTYTTDATRNLSKNCVSFNELSIPASSVVTIVINENKK